MQGNVNGNAWCKSFEIYFYKDGVRTLYEDAAGATVMEALESRIN